MNDPSLEKQIQSELNKLDGNLFLDKRWDSVRGQVYYCVAHVIDPREAPFVALEWRYFDGTPRPLSLELISKLHEQEGSYQEAVKSAIVNNAARKELARRKAQEEYLAVGHEWDYERRGKKTISYGTGGS